MAASMKGKKGLYRAYPHPDDITQGLAIGLNEDSRENPGYEKTLAMNGNCRCIAPK
jgi:hypothetical protein